MNSNIVSVHFKLVDDPLSTECYSVRLILEALEVPYQSYYEPLDALDLNILPPLLSDRGLEHESVDQFFSFLAISAQLQQQWYPNIYLNDLKHWNQFNQSLKNNLGVLRKAALDFGYFLDNEAFLIQEAESKLNQLNDHLCLQTVLGQKWLLNTEQPTLADLLIFPQVALASDAWVKLDNDLHIRRWINRIRHLPYFIPMPGLLAVH